MIYEEPSPKTANEVPIGYEPIQTDMLKTEALEIHREQFDRGSHPLLVIGQSEARFDIWIPSESSRYW